MSCLRVTHPESVYCALPCCAVLCCEQMGKVRVRQHVNPLSAQFQRPTPALDWAQVFKDPSRPLFVVSSAGQTLLRHSTAHYQAVTAVSHAAAPQQQARVAPGLGAGTS